MRKLYPMQRRRSEGITGRCVKREKGNQNGIIREIYYERNYTIAKYGNVIMIAFVPCT